MDVHGWSAAGSWEYHARFGSNYLPFKQLKEESVRKIFLSMALARENHADS